MSNASLSSGERTSFAAIEPCRIFDTRAPSLVGARGTPLGPDETWSTTARGPNGRCVIPADAVALAMNVTVVNGTSASYLTVWPGGPRPTASSLNWLGGDPPTPNKVDVRIGPSGTISLYNLTGTVDVIADVTGYYVDHNHDDRYYTKSEIDAKSPTSVSVGHTAFVDGADTEFSEGCTRRTSAGVLEASVPLPIGVIVTDFDAYVVDFDLSSDATVDLVSRGYPASALFTVASITTSGSNPFPGKSSATLLIPNVVTAGEDFFVRFSPGTNPNNISICSIEVHYHLPG